MPAEEDGRSRLENLSDKLSEMVREEKRKHPEAFEQALGRTAAATGLPPQDIRAMVTQRPDIALMQDTIPRPDPRSATRLQAAAQQADAKPAVEFAGRRFELSSVPDVFDLAELGEAVSAAEMNPLASLGEVARMLKTYVADYPALRAAFRAAGLVGDAQLEAFAGLGMGLFEAVAGRPTEPAAGSSDGRSSTSTTSRDGLSSPAAGGSTAPNGSATSTPG